MYIDPKLHVLLVSAQDDVISAVTGGDLVEAAEATYQYRLVQAMASRSRDVN